MPVVISPRNELTPDIRERNQPRIYLHTADTLNCWKHTVTIKVMASGVCTTASIHKSNFSFARSSDVNKDWTCKDQDKDFTYSYLLQVAAKPTIAIKQQQ